MRLGLIIILLCSVLWAYDWVPVYDGNHQIYDTLYYGNEMNDMIIGCENGLLISDGEEWTHVETSLPVWKVLPFDEENYIFIQGNGSYSDGVYLFNKSSHDISVLEWIIYPQFLVHDEETDLFFLGATSGLYVSNAGQLWITNPYFNGLNCKDMILHGNDYVITASGENGGVFYSNDGGTSWNSSFTEDIPFNDLALAADSTIYGVLQGETNNSGLWKSNDIGVTWEFMVNEDNCTKVGLSSLDHPFLGSVNGVYLIDSGNSTPVNFGLPNLHINGFINNSEVLSPNILAFTNNGIYMILNFFNNRNLLVPQQYATIQEAINAACNGEDVVLADGAYAGDGNKNLTWNGNLKHITVRSANGPDGCEIACSEDGIAFNFDQTSQNQQDVIDGITIRNGLNEFGNGGAIYCNSASPTIRNNVIENNVANSGGGIYCETSNSLIEDNVIRNNQATTSIFPGSVWGGGIAVEGGAPIIRNNQITENEATSSDGEVPAFGGAVSVRNSACEIRNNLILGNSANGGSSFHGYGGGIHFSNVDELQGKIENNTVVNNTGIEHNGIDVYNLESLVNNISEDGINAEFDIAGSEVSNNNSWLNDPLYSGDLPGLGDTSWGTNSNGTSCDEYYNISENPYFVSNLEHGYLLAQLEAGQVMQSACVDAGLGEPIDYNLYSYYTRTDSIFDQNTIDMGFHRPFGIVVDTEVSELEVEHIGLSNYPNPFNPSTTISFELNSETAKNAEVEIYNIKGQKIVTLSAPTQAEYSEGGQKQSATWSGNDQNNKPVSSGIYFAVLKSGESVIASKKMMLLK